MTHHTHDRPTQAPTGRAPTTTHNVARVRFRDLPPSQQAGILCNDPQFQKFAAVRCGLPDEQFSQSAAAEYLRQVCEVQSRRDLNTTPAAAAIFQHLHTNFDAWCGRIASPKGRHNER